MENFLAWGISILVIGFLGFVFLTYVYVFFDALRKAKKPKVKVPGRRGWFN